MQQPPNKTLTNLDGYVRVSRVGGRSGDSFISPDVQRQQIEAWAARHGVTISVFHEDLDQSGGTIDRPGFQAALARIEAGETDGMIVPKLDRFGRSMARIHEALERIFNAGGTLVSVADDLDFASASGKLKLNALGMVAQFQRDLATEGWDISNGRAIERGIHFTAQVPFGYVRGEDRRLVPDPATAPLVVELFRRRAQRASWRQLADFLNERWPRADGRLWGPRNPAVIIQSRTYLGEAFHGKHRNTDAHPPLVTLTEWEAANSVRGGTGAITGRSALLAGLVRCASCRYAMRRIQTTYGSGRKALVYCCAGRHTGGRCAAPASIVSHLIEPVVVDLVMAVAGHASWASQGEDRAGVEAARRQHQHAEDRLRRFLADDDLRDAVGREAFLAEAAQRRAAVDRAREELDDARQQHYIDERRRFTLDAEFPTWDTKRQGDMLRMVLDAVYVKQGRGNAEGRLMILWEGEDTFEKPRRGTTSYRVKPIPWPAALGDRRALAVPALLRAAVRAAANDDTSTNADGIAEKNTSAAVEYAA